MPRDDDGLYKNVKTFLIVALTSMSLSAPTFQSAFAQNEDQKFILAKICGSGQTIRIAIGEEEEDQPEHLQACHVLCSRDSDEETSSDSSNG